MHSVKRVRYSAEALAAKKQREQERLQRYLVLTDELLAKKRNNDWSREAFDLTTKMLHDNPEFYTIWNYRRQILLNGLFNGCSTAEKKDILLRDLALTTSALKAHPKVYWIWNHRRWCLEMVPEGPGTPGGDGDLNGWRTAIWTKELLLFVVLAWNYRRYVLASMPVPRSPMDEIKYTTRKIEANFSNFSAWHQRSKVLTSLWEDGSLDPVKSKEEEFELVQNAMYTDPDDQSVWIYHRWLIGIGDDPDLLKREIAAIQQLLDEQPDSKWCMESIVHYKRLLIRNHPASIDKEDLIRQCTKHLDELCELDPMRRKRYDDIHVSMLHESSISA
ncbi:rab-protein geranylgeranyltransferase [Fistulina hepatica ATCC 64428]|nr:rab-protein geranylgeranyltransferase [Fistulina hepatica ATCC 64428]